MVRADEKMAFSCLITLAFLSVSGSQNTRQVMYSHVRNTNMDNVLGYPVSTRTHCVILCISDVNCASAIYCGGIRQTCTLRNGKDANGKAVNKTQGNCEVYGSFDRSSQAQSLGTKSATATPVPDDPKISTEYADFNGTFEPASITAPASVTEETTNLCQNGGTPGAVCNCPEATTGSYCETRIHDCDDVAKYVSTSSGMYFIWPTTYLEPYQLFCVFGTK